MAGGNSITRRISLEGAEEIIESLKKLGETGKEAFEGIKKSAEGVKGPEPGLLDKLKQQLQSVGAAVVETGKSVVEFGTQLSKVGAAVGGLVLGLGLLANSAAEAADDIAKNAEQVGLTTDAYQKLAFAARQSDVDTDTFRTGMGRLAKQLEDARDGNKEAIETFQKLGFSLREIETVTPDEAIRKLAEHFAALPDGIEKSAAAIKVFGRGGIALIPFLNEGSKGIEEFGKDFDRLALGLTEDQIKIAKTFIEAKHALEDSFASFKNQLGLIFVPALTEATKAIVEFIATNKPLILGFVQAIVDAFTALPEPVQHMIEAFAAFVLVIGPIVIAVGLFVQAIGFALAGIGSLIGGIGALGTAITSGLAIALEGGAAAIGLLLSPIGLTILAIAAFVAAVAFLAVETVKHWDEITKAWDDFKTSFIATVAQIVTAIRGLPAAFAGWLGDVVGRAAAAAKAIVDYFAAVPGKIIALFKSFVADFFLLLGDLEGKAAAAATSIKDAFFQAFNDIWNKVKSVVDDVLHWLDDLIQKALQAAASVVGLSGGGPGGAATFSGGGQARGPGTSTSDSIPARLSDGEFVMRAKAVRRHGVGFMQRINSLQMPRFAMGGLVAPALSFAGGGLVSDTGSGPLMAVNLHLDRQQYPLVGPQQVVDDLMLAIRQRDLASAGKVPGV